MLTLKLLIIYIYLWTQNIYTNKEKSQESYYVSILFSLNKRIVHLVKVQQHTEHEEKKDKQQASDKDY